MWTVAFWKATAERTIMTMVEVLIPLIGATTLNLIDWVATLWIVVTAGALALLKSVLAARVGNNGPSLTSAESLVHKEAA